MNTRNYLASLLLVIMTGIVTPASAIPRTGRYITGVIQKVDVPNQEVALLREDSGGVVSFIWNKRTDFIASGKFTDAAILKKGARVEVIRHAPFFGKPFVTKVTLLPATNPQTKTK